MTIKGKIRDALFQRGYHIERIDPNGLGHDPFRDIRRLIGDRSGATVFDIGANVGQTVQAFRKHLSSPIIYSFEPSPSVFEKLKQRTAGIPDLHLHNLALGSRSERKLFNENTQSTQASFLQVGKDYLWDGKVSRQVDVEVESVDGYCERSGIKKIDVLKCDTQGYDLEVLKGAIHMFQQHKVHLVLVELILLELYAEMPKFEDIYGYLTAAGFSPVGFYNQFFKDSKLGWMDGLFINSQWQ